MHALEVSDYTALLNSALGLHLTEEELMNIARRSRNLEKAFNTLHTSMGRHDDLPPKRYMDEPVKSGPYRGYRADREEWEKMLDEFYDLQGWDKATGLQTRKTLVDLEMGNIAERLDNAGKLIQ